MGAEAAWSLLLDGADVPPLHAPTVFNLDGDAADLDFQTGIGTYDLRRGKAPLRGAWWRLTLDSTLGEIQQRYGEARRVWLVRDDSAGTAS